MRQLRYICGNFVRTLAEFFQDQWFDRTRNVRTSGNVTLRRAGIPSDQTADSELYVPARPHHIRQALRATPIPNPSGYHYIDLGSGKGRTLFIAAELPFQQITGVEFSKLLHDQACTNIQSFRLGKRRERRAAINSIHQNAKDFAFPDQPLILYLFNPFGAETMQQVLQNLQDSLVRHPRHVVIVLLWPRCADQVAQVQGMCLLQTTNHHQIFEANSPAPQKTVS